MEILEIADRVKRTSHRVKNAGNKTLYLKGLKIARLIKQKNDHLVALKLEEDFTKELKNYYTPQKETITKAPANPTTAPINTPTGISQQPVIKNMADGYGPDDPQIDYDQISDFEGGQQTGGYVPKDQDGDPADKSGVTVGTGVDIGQMSQSDINNLDIPQSLKDKLSPYTGLTGDDAVDALNNSPLTLTDDEADALDKAINEKATDALVDAYDSETTGASFTSLPPEMQTVIASVAYQHGDLATSCPNFWADVTQGNWNAALNELRNFKDDFPTRRNAEADLLEQGIQKLPIKVDDNFNKPNNNA